MQRRDVVWSEFVVEAELQEEALEIAKKKAFALEDVFDAETTVFYIEDKEFIP